ncbi:MAG TPA: class I SAM-dependent RNA methyltransferase [Candidatus Binataceae bacterium]|nr:class I SAM-dependent RNA methyltransferase [Candidatus Binataceae bacterium]
MEIEITAMTSGPYGLGHHEGKAVLISGVAPGDVIEAIVAAEHRDYTIARAARVLHASPVRRAPPCPFLPRCGGCDWQHLDYAAQVRIKAELIAAEFKRALGIELPLEGLVEASPAEFAYRSRIRLQVGRDGAIGYHAAGSNDLVAIDRCMVAISESVPANVASQLGRRCRSIEVVADNGREVLIVDLAKTATSAEIAIARRMLESGRGIKGIILRCGGDRITLGDCIITLEPEAGCAIEAEADCFNQVNREQNRKLVAAVIEMAQPREGLAILDLFCGAGNFSVPLARRGARVTAVDADSLAIAAAARNAHRMGLRDTQFIAMKASETARFLARAHYHPDVVTLDPPRHGAAELIAPVARLKPASIIYVSCDCATLVRDLQALHSFGYEIAQVRAFDFFPNTHHAEVAVRALLT